MSFFGNIFGTPTPKQEEHSSSAELFSSTKFQSPSSSSSLPNPPPAGPAGGGVAPLPPINEIAPTAFDTFSSAFDPAKLHPLAGLGDQLDFLQLDEDKLTDVDGAASVLPSRGWTDDLCVGTGTTYLSGLVLGGAWGMKEGITRPLGASPSFKLRLNSVLNGATRRGSYLGNSLGVLAIFYNLTNSSLDSVRGRHDIFNAMGAGAISGGLYKATAGVRPALVGATIMTGAAGFWTWFKTVV